jgi:hypothetical protein
VRFDASKGQLLQIRPHKVVVNYESGQCAVLVLSYTLSLEMQVGRSPMLLYCGGALARSATLAEFIVENARRHYLPQHSLDLAY